MTAASSSTNSDMMYPLRMGLEPLSLETWLKARPADDDLLTERRKIITAHRGDVIASLPEADEAVTDLADFLRDRNALTTYEGTAPEILEAVGTSIAEDICVLTKQDGLYRLTAAVLCFPNRWRLADKMGRSITDIHAPVPGYAAQIADTVDRFLARLRPQRAFVRDNWGLATSPALYLPEPIAPAWIGAEQSLYYRREEQSFLKLPRTGAVIFSIRTTITPWAKVPTRTREAIAAAVQTLSPEWLAYKALKTD